MARVNTDVAQSAGKKGTERCVPPGCGGYQAAMGDARTSLARTKAHTTLVARDPATIQQLRALQAELKGNLDAMGEMGEMQSRRMQMIMERRDKAMSTLSNIMRKISTTQETLVQNLK